MRDALTFTVLLVILSQPDFCFCFREYIILFMSASVIRIIFMLVEFLAN